MYAIIEMMTPIIASPAISPLEKNIKSSTGFLGITEKIKLKNPPTNTGIVNASGRYII